jgi:hypothetical protein
MLQKLYAEENVMAKKSIKKHLIRSRMSGSNMTYSCPDADRNLQKKRRELLPSSVVDSDPVRTGIFICNKYCVKFVGGQ